MSVMSPTIGLISDLSGSFTIPQSVVLDHEYGGQSVPLYNTIFNSDIAGYPCKEYRHPDIGRVVFIMELGITADNNQLMVAWVPAASVDAPNTTFDLVIKHSDFKSRVLAQWDVDASSGYVIPTLDADTGSLAQSVRDIWPTDWRLNTDTSGSFLASVLA